MIDFERLAVLMAEFESGEGDFESIGGDEFLHDVELSNVVQAFVSGCAVPDTLQVLATDIPDASTEDKVITCAIAAFVQGFVIGRRYQIVEDA